MHGAVLDAAAGLVAAHGLTGITMSAIAEATGIGRATLYKYFPDVEAILVAWHDRQVRTHLAELAEVAAAPRPPSERLRIVLMHFAMSARHSRGTAIGALLHRRDGIDDAHAELAALLASIIAEGVAVGKVRADVPAAELAQFCLSAMSAGGSLNDPAALHRLVEVTLSGLRPPQAAPG